MGAVALRSFASAGFRERPGWRHRKTPMGWNRHPKNMGGGEGLSYLCTPGAGSPSRVRFWGSTNPKGEILQDPWIFPFCTRTDGTMRQSDKTAEDEILHLSQSPLKPLHLNRRSPQVAHRCCTPFLTFLKVSGWGGDDGWSAGEVEYDRRRIAHCARRSRWESYRGMQAFAQE